MTMSSTNNANDILERLRRLGACGDAVRPEPTVDGDTGWVVKALETNSPDEVWRHAVFNHLADAWWLAWRMGVARPALELVARRALTYAAGAAEAAGLDGSELRRVAEVLDHEAAEAAARAAWSAWAAEVAWARASGTAEAAEAAGARAAAAECGQQREQLLGLWSEVYAALKGET